MLKAIAEKLDFLKTLDTRITELQQQYKNAGIAAQRARTAADEARKAAENFLHINARGDERKLDDIARKHYQALLAEQHQADARATETVEAVDKVRTALDQLKSQRDATPPAVTLDDLAEHQEKITKAGAECDRLCQLVAVQEAAIKAIDDTAVSEARAQRQTVLADIAEGKGKQADLTAANKALTAAEQALVQAGFPAAVLDRRASMV